MKEFFSPNLTVSRFVVNKQNDSDVMIVGEEKKYRSKVEKFLEDLLEEGEEFIVYHPPNSTAVKEYADDVQTFHIDKFKSESHRSDAPKNIPVYSSQFEDSLKNIKTVKCETEKANEDRPSLVTCFNCLGNHHMKECPDKLDYSRISINKRGILMENSIRYHGDDQKSSFMPGNLSNQLRDALGLQKNELPMFIYRMRVLGYPPGWMNEAVFEKSGLSLYDQDGKALVSTEDSVPSVRGTLYDGNKFIEYPGFNMPVPHGFLDEWKERKMPPVQEHQQLEIALKSPNIIFSNSSKRRQHLPGNIDFKKHKNVEEKSSHLSINESTKREPSRSQQIFNNATPDLKQEHKRLSLSVSVSPGTPILKQGNLFKRLPDADKFSQGITEHLPFENLPDAVGSFEKMRGVISTVQKKIHFLNS